MRANRRERDRERECKWGRHTLRSNTIDEQAATETMREREKEKQWKDRETERGQNRENGKRVEKCDEALWWSKGK